MAMQVLSSAWSSPGQLTGLIVYYEICLLLLITQVFESGFTDHYSEAEEARNVGVFEGAQISKMVSTPSVATATQWQRTRKSYGDWGIPQ